MQGVIAKHLVDIISEELNSTARDELWKKTHAMRGHAAMPDRVTVSRAW